ncbi:Uncharacterised protein [uncultured archaeon]|nr:Uncharacterised protein [uncultured archaeon]
MQMMSLVTDSPTQWAVYALIIVVAILGLIIIYLSYMILAELKEMRLVFERVEKLLKSVE